MENGYHVCVRSDNNNLCITNASFTLKDDAVRYMRNNYGRSTRYCVKFVVNGKIV
jgi:hypothetical protein